MSGPGFFYSDEQSPELTAQQRMAMALTQGQKPYNPNQAYSGIADAGQSLAGAMAYNKYADDKKWAAQGISPVQITPRAGTTGLSRAGDWASKLFSFGGGK
jgi:hypothetical protein